MSTRISTDMGELKRPTTRVHAPPGGGSTFVFGDDSTSASLGTNSRNPPHFDTKTELPPPTPLQSPMDVVAFKTSTRVRVALIQTTSDAELINAAVQNCQTKLQTQSLDFEIFQVGTIEQLPYAANKVTKSGAFDGAICFGYLATQDPQFATFSAALTQSFMKISVQNVRPIVQALLMTESRVALVKVRSGWGTAFADDIMALIHVGGYNKPSMYPASGALENKPFEISRGNLLPAKLLRGSTTVQQSLERLRTSLFEHGATGIRTLGRKFRIIDDDGNRLLSLEEFRKALREHAMALRESDQDELFHFIDTNHSGSINYDEFLLAVRGELNDRRMQLVLMAFQSLDTDGNHVVDLNDLKGKYNVTKHPQVLEGRKTEDEVLLEFLDTFDGGAKDNKVHPNEFVRYYANISASIDDDDYFELMIRNAWHLSGGEGACANTTCRRVLVEHDDGSHTIEEVKNDMGIAAGNVEAIRTNLQAQGIQDIQSVSMKDTIQTEANKRANFVFLKNYYFLIWDKKNKVDLRRAVIGCLVAAVLLGSNTPAKLDEWYYVVSTLGAPSSLDLD
ncbi:uncharacterized protein CCR75_002725 [Bremia lactucae]|uniref:EF-hand domain-containing protein n=1 Tax=Bremia lactucae TaxID=4779 RepID=A0A976IBW0_BRELC|nr:hypothetical protein CCR75_002725 [Bremia lactucae]